MAANDQRFSQVEGYSCEIWTVSETSPQQHDLSTSSCPLHSLQSCVSSNYRSVDFSVWGAYQRKHWSVCSSNDLRHGRISSVQFSSVTQSCPTLCDPMDCSTPGLPVHCQFPEFTQTHVHRVSDAIQPSHPDSPIFLSIRVFSDESVLRIRWPKYWSFSFSISPSNECSGLISFRMDWLDLLAVQGTLKILLQHHSSKVSILRHSLENISPLNRSWILDHLRQKPRKGLLLTPPSPGWGQKYWTPQGDSNDYILHWKIFKFCTSLFFLNNLWPSSYTTGRT